MAAGNSFAQQIREGQEKVRQFVSELGVDAQLLEWGPMDGEACYALLLRTELGCRPLLRFGKNELARYAGGGSPAEETNLLIRRQVRASLARLPAVARRCGTTDDRGVLAVRI